MSLESSVLVVAGEPSGDFAAAGVAREIIADHGVRVFGVGGDHMAREGVELVTNISTAAGMGIGATVGALGFWLKTWAKIRAVVDERCPKAALLVDSPELNLPLARVLKAAKIPVVYYIGPQVWAWRAHRLKLLKARTDNVALILPFELPLYQAAGIKAEFVSHPLLDVTARYSRAEVRRSLHVSDNMPLVAMLPGSRRAEVETMALPMIEAGLSVLRSGGRAVLAPAPKVASAAVINKARFDGCTILPHKFTARDLLRACDAALVTSGTATLEAAIEGAPMAIVYKTDPVSFFAAKKLVKVPFAGLPNLLAKREIVPELFQDKVSGKNLFNAVKKLLSASEQARQKKELALVANQLGSPNAAIRVAQMLAPWISSSVAVNILP